MSDQSADGAADAEKILRAKWPNFTMNYDLWHKIYPFTAAWKTFVSTRTHKRGPLKYPKLNELNNSNKLTANNFKKWWIHCSENANGSAKLFLDLWLGAAKHYADKYFR